jgi:ABC-type lipoprotein release transport system permease subunit
VIAARGALSAVRARPARTLLAAAGVFAAAALLGTSVTVAFALSTGFGRAAERADLPDVVVRFGGEPLADVDRRIRALPNLEARSYRLEARDVPIASRAERRRRTAVEIVGRGRRGYAVVDGHDLSGSFGEVVMERGLARAWSLHPGDRVRVGRLRLRLAGIVVSPDDVAYPLVSRPRVWIPSAGLRLPDGAGAPVNTALVWVRDPSKVDATLVQARAVGFGLRDVRITTRDGIRVLVDRAAGLVIALLIAFSLVAAGAAGLMLGASARADVQRRLTSVGVLRAMGFSRRRVTAGHALESVIVTVPAAALGLAVGAAAAAGPTARLLDVLSELPPGAALVPPLVGCLALVTALVAGATAWPAWRATGLQPATVLRGAELRYAPRRMPGSGGPLGLGVRLMAARRGRSAATVAVLAAASAVVLLLLGLASFLARLQDDPGSVGRRYDLTASLPANRTGEVARIPGVEAAAPRYVEEAVDSFDIGEPVKLIAFPGDHTRFEAAPLAGGRRVRRDAEAEVGLGLADALGLSRGGTLAVQTGSGAEARFRVVGLVRSIENDGRVAYIRPRRLLDAEPLLDPTIAVRLDDRADRDEVIADLQDLGAAARPASGATTRNAAFLGVLAGVLRAVAGVSALICLYVLVQSLALTAVERRPVLSVLRAVGAARTTLLLVLAGAATSVAAAAGLVAIVVERLVMAPLVARLAAGYASLPLGAGAGHVALVLAGLLALAGAAAVVTVQRVERESIVAGLRGE